MNYRIIKNKEALLKFIDWLPDLEDGEQFYVSLFARAKYDNNNILKSDKAKVGRTSATKERLYDKIKKMEVEVGSYKTGDIVVPQETLALYINPNPRSMKKASIETAKMILSNIEKGRYQNPKSIALNAIQVSKSRTCHVDFDMDSFSEISDKHVKDLAFEATGNENAYEIVKTRGGYHVLVDPRKTVYKQWHRTLSENKYIDQAGDMLMPVPGCVQGDFVPKMI